MSEYERCLLWWRYFDLHSKEIRNVVKEFLPSKKVTLTYTPPARQRKEIADLAKITADKINTSNAKRRLPSMKDFDSAVTVRSDASKTLLIAIMTQSWFSAPDTQEVYKIPGFTEMCNLLDGTFETER